MRVFAELQESASLIFRSDFRLLLGDADAEGIDSIFESE